MVRRPIGRWVGVVFAAFIGWAGCAPDMATRQKSLEPHYRVQQPHGQGPFPAILLVPGCGGVSSARVQTAQQLASRGYAVAFVDYISARRLQTACRGEVNLDEIVADIRAVSAHVRALPNIEPTALGIVGWSWGGAGVLASLAAMDQDQPAPFRAAAVFYPVCEGLRPWGGTMPALVLLAGQDDIAPPGPCQELLRNVGARAPVVVRIYPDARHSFDVSDLPTTAPARSFPGKTVGYHPQAARQAWDEIGALFDQKVRQAK